MLLLKLIILFSSLGNQQHMQALEGTWIGPGGMVIGIRGITTLADGGYGATLDKGYDQFWRKYVTSNKFMNIHYRSSGSYSGRNYYKPQAGYSSPFYVDSEITLAKDGMSFTAYELAFDRTTIWYKAKVKDDGSGYERINR